MPGSVFFLVLRRLRAPVILMVVVYAIGIAGLVLIPGADAGGRPWRMTVFQALYFMSYTATTIGFGEIPYPFTDAQRLWVMATIYLTVVGWAYAISALLTLLLTMLIHMGGRTVGMRPLPVPVLSTSVPVAAIAASAPVRPAPGSSSTAAGAASAPPTRAGAAAARSDSPGRT